MAPNIRSENIFPRLNACCFCVSLYLGALIGACIGIMWGVLHLFAYTPVGAAVLESLGLPAYLFNVRGIRLFHFAFGVLLVAAHALLLGALLAQNSALSSLYCGCALALACPVVVGTAWAATTFLFTKTVAVAVVTFIVGLFAGLCLLYLGAIVANYKSTIVPAGS